MTLDEAIVHAEERANADCSECASEHRQLAEWLKLLRDKLARKGEWILYDCGKEHYCSYCGVCAEGCFTDYCPNCGAIMNNKL